MALQQKPPRSNLAYSYVRFSTPEQLKGDSLRRQTESSEAYAREHGLTLDRSLNLQDLGVSAFRGKNAAEGALAGFLTAIQTGKVRPGSTLLVESLDRLSRDQITSALTQFLSIINSGVTVVTLLDRMVYSTESINNNPGALMLSIVVMMRAHEESATKAHRVAKAWARKRDLAQAQRTPMTNRCPAWLRLSPEGYKTIPERADIVRKIFQLAAQGLGKRSIAKILNAEKIDTWGDGINANRKANGWHDSYVLKITNNPAVLGIYQPHKVDPETHKRVPDGDPIAGYFPAVIKPEEWQAAHSRPTAPRGPRPQRINNLFSGIVYDGYTGAVMRYIDKTSKSSDRDRGDLRYLRSDIERTAPGTKGQTWPYRHFEQTLLTYLRELDWASLTTTKSDPEQTRLQAKEARLILESNKLQEGINRILDQFAAGDQPAALAKAAQSRAADLARQLEENQSLLHETQEALAKSQSHTAAVTDGVEEFKKLIIAGEPNQRLRLQTEIRRRVKYIHTYRHGVPNEDGIILNNTPALEIQYPNGQSRWIWIGTDNPMSKPRVYDQPRDPRTGAYISRNPKNQNRKPA